MRNFTSKFWKPEEWRRIVEVAKVNWGLGRAPEYERLLSFFTSYVMGQSGPAQLTLMADQYSLWRTARAIATALWLLAGEAIIVSIILGFLPSALIIFLISWMILGFTFIIIRGPYSRLCFTLFSLLYMAREKQIVPQKNADHPAS